MQAQAPLTPQQVYEAISGATNLDARTRSESETLLRSWERDAAPGFLDSLLQIASQTGFVDEARSLSNLAGLYLPNTHSSVESRILAAVVAKNAVGSSWRKTLGSREWSRLQEGEKATVRRRALECLLEDPSERVAMQICLLIANVARFDFPAEWSSLLAELLKAASFASRVPVSGKRRALRALKHVMRALRSKRFVAEAPPHHGEGRISREDLAPLADRIMKQRKLLNQQVEAAFQMVKDIWEQNFAALAEGAEGWQERGGLANQALLVMREVLMLLPSWDSLQEPMRQFLQTVHSAASLTSAMVPLEEGEGQRQAENNRLALGGKAFERLTQCLMAAMDRNPAEFALYLPHFLPLYSNNTLLLADVATVHRMRAKRRVLLMRFLARALLCPVYQVDWLKAQFEVAAEGKQKEEVRAIWPKIAAADAALNELLTEPQCTRLVESIISKYLAMTPSELEEWQADPEQYVRAGDVEATPDADTPRSCGVALLLCMLSRGEQAVAVALIQLASKLQMQPRTPEVLQLQEACYRGLGEAFSQLRKLPGIQFVDWYASELRGLLQLGDAQAQQVPVHARALSARAVWLLGICSSELQPDMWCDALGLVSTNLRHSDLVICLTAASALAGMLGLLLEQSEMLSEVEALQSSRPVGVHTAAEEAMTALEQMKLDTVAVANKKAAFQAKLEVLERQAGTVLTLALALEGRLEEMESKVRVLQLVTVLIELLGDKAQPYVGIVAEALPKVWSAASEASSSGKETGAVARLHGALIGVLTHLVDRLGRLATEDARIAQVLPPLLEHALDLSNPESDALVEDALKLLRVTLSGCAQLAPQLQALLPRVFEILNRGKESTAAVAVLEGYILLSGEGLPSLLQPHMASITVALERCVNAAANAIANRDSQTDAALTAPHSGQQAAKDVPKETIADAMAASSLCTLLLQLSVDPSALGAVLRSMALILSSKRATELPVNVTDRERNVGSIFEGFLEVLTRVLFAQPQALAGLVGDDADIEGRLIDRWLLIASRKYLGEVLGNPRLASLGRLRRQMAVASLCRIACSQSSQALRDPRRMARALALGLRTVAERPAYLSDQRDMDEVIQQQAQGSDVIRDTILSRRLALTRVDAIRHFDTRAALSEAARVAIAFCPQEQMVEQLSLVDHRLPAQLRELVGGGGEPPSANGATVAAPRPRGAMSI